MESHFELKPTSTNDGNVQLAKKENSGTAGLHTAEDFGARVWNDITHMSMQDWLAATVPIPEQNVYAAQEWAKSFKGFEERHPTAAKVIRELVKGASAAAI